MVDGDIFREIDEELRREQFAKLWDKYGTYVLALAIGIVALVAGYKYWKYQQAEQSAVYGSKYMDALELAGNGKRTAADEKFAAIAAKGPRGYAMLAKLREASSKAAAGKLGEAVIGYDKLATSGSIDPVFQNFARIQAAMMRVDDAPLEEMQKRLDGLAKGGSSWRHSARELLGLSAFGAKDMKAAEDYYNRLLNDPAAPNGIRGRAEMMLALILEETAGKTAKATGEKGAAGEKAPDAASKEAAKPEAAKKEVPAAKEHQREPAAKPASAKPASAKPASASPAAAKKKPRTFKIPH